MLVWSDVSEERAVGQFSVRTTLRNVSVYNIWYCVCMQPVVLYGCETRSLTLREEPRLKLFENRMLRRIFGSKRDEVTSELRKLHNEELSDLYSSPNIFRVINSRRMRWAGHVARMGERRGVYRVLVGKPEGKKITWGTQA